MNNRISKIAEDSGMTQYVAANNKYLERFAQAIIDEVVSVMTNAETDLREKYSWIKNDMIQTKYHIENIEKHFADSE